MNPENESYDIYLSFEPIYTSFSEFFIENKGEIYGKFLELFHKMNNETEQKIFSLCINWNVHDTNINTEYQYDRTSIELLNEVLLPYFVEIEEYEICDEIKKLYEKLNNV